jgi:lipopolysaccharide transport system permease protein
MWSRKNWVQLVRYVNIVLFKTYANVKGEIEKTYLGCFWWILEPMINTAVYYFICVYILKNKSENFVAFLYTGMVVYSWFSNGISTGANSIISNSGIMQQIRLPKVLLHIVAISNLTWKFIFSLTVLFILVWIHKCPITLAYFSLPILIILQYFVIICLSLPLAVLMPYFQDGRTVLSSILSVLIWFSGVFYGSERIPHRFLKWYYLNPAASLVDSYHLVLMQGKWPHWNLLIFPFLISIISLWIGMTMLKKVDKELLKMPL